MNTNTLFDKFKLVALNIMMLIPVFVITIISAVYLAIVSKKLKDVQKSFPADKAALDSAYKYSTQVTITLWILGVGVPLFMMTFGILFIPMLLNVSYLYGGIMILFALLNIAIAGVMFYVNVQIKKTAAYKAKNDSAMTVQKNSLTAGLLMLAAGVLMILYAMWAIYKYRKGGGISSDIAVVAGVMGGQAPSKGVAPVWNVAQQMAQKNLGQEQYQQIQGQTGQTTQGLQQMFNPSAQVQVQQPVAAPVAATQPMQSAQPLPNVNPVTQALLQTVGQYAQQAMQKPQPK